MVATPIGNLADITLRALAALSAADVVCAEDTRVTGQLLKAYGIHARRLVSLREHNERSMAEQVVAWLAEGKIVVQVSDAGTPSVSDPGARLAEVVHRAGHPVSPVPGASAVIAALSASGVPDDRFAFYGFLPPKSGERRKVLTELVAAPHATVCYEAPHRLVDTLTDLVEVLGPERPVLLARELTKAFETLRQLPAGGLLDWVKGDPNQTRGEIVLVIAGVRPAAASDMPALPEEALRVLRILAAELPTKQAATLTAEITGENRKALYDAALALKAER
ncbi:16S rRNA (cytidine(1402)-2'-O)-methyltransferase [Gulbenkiania mobilis]|uniref:16S rRNA (cytidine(1402)-2'-O)-methyltransferase n=1 Tax=Gulbenkiania mobilis TaxID=397457 RepID=UPI0006BC0342|nr:16S rRNA (cytidine(1402)-2'-O)-methyltransferase [Gulbenkiania mobilis]